MRGMRERARLAGARLEIGDSDHGGTRVAVSWE
jgi:two-component system sensor histidine kinase DesK